MFQDKIKYKDSLATRLLVNIFGLYFIVTVIVTIAQLSAEYHHVKKTVVKEIQMLPKTFGDGLVESLWMYNNDLLHSILVGMQEISVVSGVKIENKHGEEIDSIGNLIDKNGQYVKFDRNKRQIFHRKKDILLEKLFLYSFPLIYIVEVDAVDFEQKKTDSTEKYSFNNKLKILLAEDDEFNSKTMIYFLKRKGHDVTHVYNGYEVLDALENYTYDIILMDIQMPEMDGTEATKQIRNSNTGKFDPKIPIIALTAYAMKGDKERFLSAGMNGYITKPVKIDNLLEKMESISKKYQSA